MVTGELDFGSIFGLDAPASDYVPIPFHEVSFFMWIIFLILIPIILNNMLVSCECVNLCSCYYCQYTLLKTTYLLF